MKYQLQEARGGQNWQDVDEYPRDQADLNAWIEIGRSQDTHGGKYFYRIVDDVGNPVWQMQEPYEVVSVNIYAEDKGDWMEKMRRGYGVTPEVWRQACEQWLTRSQL